MQPIDPSHDFITAFRQRAAELRRDTLSTPSHWEPLVDASLAELDTALEELRTSEEELRQQNDQLTVIQELAEAERRRCHELFHLLPEACLATDRAGMIREANRAAELLLSAPREMLLGKPLVAFVAERDRHVFLTRLGRVPNAGGRERWDLLLQPRQSFPIGVEITVAAAGACAADPSLLHWVVRDVIGRPSPIPSDSAAAVERRGEGERVSLPVLIARPFEIDGINLLDKLRRGIASALHLGTIRGGDRLPSIREIARETGLDHRVITRAYRQLEADGMVEVRGRSGVYAASHETAKLSPAGETAAWLAEVLTGAWEKQIRVDSLPRIIRRWTADAPLRCACVESTEDDRVALCTELRRQFSLKSFAVSAPPFSSRDAPRRRAERFFLGPTDADLMVTTPFHTALARSAAAAGLPVLVMTWNPDIVAELERHLAVGMVTAVIADPRFGERLRSAWGGRFRNRFHVVLADDAEALEALDSGKRVFMTRAARDRIRNHFPDKRLRLLVPLAPFLSPSSARQLAETLIRLNGSVRRG